jgi:hypothetical protein
LYGGPVYDIFGNKRGEYNSEEQSNRQRYNKLAVRGRNNEMLVLPALNNKNER